MTATARNILIIVAIAAGVDLIPGGGAGAHTALQAVQIVFLGSIGWFAAMMYRQHRVDLFSLGDAKRAGLYVSAGVILVTLTASSRMTATGGGTLAFVVLLVASAYTIFAIVWSARQY
jgi:hypothetical protein